jgi:putative transposase
MSGAWRPEYEHPAVVVLGEEMLMARGPFCEPIVLSQEEREQLQAFARSRSLPHSLVRRAKIIMRAAEGVKSTEIAAQLGVHHGTVYLWRRRFSEHRVAGLYDEVRPGRPRTIAEERLAELLDRTLQTKPEGGSHWSCRSMADQTGIPKSTVHRIWQAFAVKPHRYKHFKLSTDPFFVEKVRDVVGLYLAPPDNAIVFCVDEKSQCQALERAQPVLPMGLGYLEGITDNYIRHGTTTLFAALDVATGAVLTQCSARHRHQEFLRFLRTIDASVPAELAVHLVLDNYSTHRHRAVKLWLARHPRFTVHFTPTYSSWLNQVEIWFNLITSKAIRRGSFPCTKALIQQIDAFVRAYNPSATPFVWTATAESILEKIGRLLGRIREPAKSSKSHLRDSYGTRH